MWAKSGSSSAAHWRPTSESASQDMYFSADVETDGPIPGPYSMLSFALVVAGSFNGRRFHRPETYDESFYAQLAPISDEFEPEALAVNGLDRDALIKIGTPPAQAMRDASHWIRERCGDAKPVLVAYPLSFDWSWLYWYFIRFTGASPFKHSQCFDIKTAVAVKRGIPLSTAGRKHLPPRLRSTKDNTHHAVDDAIAQAEIFANVFEYQGGED